jgi:DNA-binding response OmpR family regulator
MVHRRPTAPEDPVPQPQQSPPLPPSRVLVVDDAKLLATLLVDSLSKAGYHASPARSGREALHCLENTPFDLVLLDITLPDSNGYSLCQQIRQLYQIPVVAMSANDETEQRINALVAGASTFLGKPFSLKEVQSAIHETLTEAAR